MTAAPGTDHDDLMDIASRIAYQDGLDPQDPLLNTITVNGRVYDVLDVHTDTVTGLDAFTFRNTVTGEVTVAFQGSDGGTDWANNAVLVTQMTPEQFQAAEDYVKNVDGDVDFVCGNSLGGGLAAYVAGRDRDIEAVTVNPAPVPASLANADAPNVRNYITSNDMLHQLVVAGGLGDRIIGEQVTVPGTTTNDIFGPNHIGSDRDDGLYDASMATAFSLFTENMVVSEGSYGEAIDITPDNLDLMVGGLSAQHHDLTGVLRAELGTMAAGLQDHAARITAREQQSRAWIADMFEFVHAMVRRQIEELREDLHHLRRTVHRVPTPALPPLVPVWKPVCESLLRAVDQALLGLEELADIVTPVAVDGVWTGYCFMVTDLSQAIVSGLIAQNTDLQADIRIVTRKWKAFLAMSTAVAAEIRRVDAATAAAIASRHCPPDALARVPVTWPKDKTRGVTEDLAKHFAQTTTEVRDECASRFVTVLAVELSTLLTPCTLAVDAAYAAMEVAEQLVTGVLTTIGALSAPAAFVESLIGASHDIEEFRTCVYETREEVHRTINTTQEYARAITQAIDELPSLVLSAQPQIEDLIIGDDEIEAVYDSFSKIRNLIDRSTLAFDEAQHQLTTHTATTIRALASRADDVHDDLTTVSSTLDEIIT